MVTATTTTSATGSSIAQSLGVGSGIDIGGLVDSLVTNQFQLKNQALSAQADKLTAQISGVTKLKSGITGFASALQSLAKGGTVSSTATTSDASVVRATALAGASLSGLATTITVGQLAAGQNATTAAMGLKRTDPVGTGTITIDFGTRATPDDPTTFQATTPADRLTLDIGATDGTLDGIAAKINAAGRGMSATVVTAANGDARMVIKGPTGAAKAFAITTTDSRADPAAGPGLAMLNTSGGSIVVGGTPSDAELNVDGIPVTRSSNSVSDLIAGVRLDLSKVSSTPVTIGSTAPLAGLTQAVSDVVDTYNEMLSVITEETNAKTGSLYGDSAATALTRSLSQLTLKPLISNAPKGTPTTLAEIGVGTNRDGTLKLDVARLTAAITQWPAAIEAMFATTGSASGDGLPAALSAIATAATSVTSGLDASAKRYSSAQVNLTDLQTKAATDAETSRTRLTQQFAAMDARVASYKSTQAFLTQQIDVWTKSDS